MWPFEGHGLEFMPLGVRRKLDIAGLKPTLAAWSALPLADREALENEPEERFADRVRALIPSAPRITPSDRPWNRAEAIVVARAKTLGFALDWSALGDDARYALHHLEGRDPERFGAAVAYFSAASRR